jgi:NifU-like protein involved in Fe-S cluster formation
MRRGLRELLMHGELQAAAARAEALRKLPPVKLHCSMLAEDAIKAAVKDFQKKRDSAKETA